MKKFLRVLFIAALALGQAPAWAQLCQPRCASKPSLACLRACAKSKALLTEHGRYDSVGQACGQVQLRFAQPALSSLAAPSLEVPVSPALAGGLESAAAQPLPYINAMAQGPPSAKVS